MHKLQQVRESCGLSVKQVAERSHIGEGTIRAIESGSKVFKTNDKVAELLAEALDVPVEAIFCSEEISPYGRPGGTGRPISSGQPLQVIKPYETLCIDCNVVHPRSSECPVCQKSA